MNDINEIKSKFENSVFENIDKENFSKILKFLLDEKCDFVEDIISDYLDLFLIEYNEFINKYSLLNEKYNGKFLEEASKDMDILEEFFNVSISN